MTFDSFGSSPLGERMESALGAFAKGTSQAKISAAGVFQRLFDVHSGVISFGGPGLVFDVSDDLSSIIIARDMGFNHGGRVFARGIATSGHFYNFGSVNVPEDFGILPVIYKITKGSTVHTVTRYNGAYDGTFQDAIKLSSGFLALSNHFLTDLQANTYLLDVNDNATPVSNHKYSEIGVELIGIGLAQDTASIWVFGGNAPAGTIFYMQVSKLDYSVTKSKNITVTSETWFNSGPFGQGVNTIRAGGCLIDGSTLLVYFWYSSAARPIIIAIDTITDTVLWAKKVGGGVGFLIADIAIYGGSLYAVGSSGTLMTVLQLSVSDGSVQNINRIPGTINDQLNAIKSHSGTLYMGGFTSPDNTAQLFKVSGISDTGDDFGITDPSCAIGAKTVVHTTATNPTTPALTADTVTQLTDRTITPTTLEI